jgi:amidase
MTLPAMQSALYSLKPTVGLLSRVGVVPFAPSFDTPGTMAKDVWSVAVGMDVMAGEDEEDIESLTVPRLPKSMRVSVIHPSTENIS